MSIKDDYIVQSIPKEQTHEWLLKKHYAHRIPSISYAFGLYDKNKILQGICTFGYPPNYEYNDGKCVFKNYRCITLELNRLVINDNLPSNILSYFLSKCLKSLPTPSCIVSYADPNNGHCGYIYQATNWLYSGVSTSKVQYIFASGEIYDIRRGIDTKGEIVAKKPLKPTHRYFKFLGSKKDVNIMKNDFDFPILPYPKGDNKRYDASYEPTIQGVMFL